MRRPSWRLKNAAKAALMAKWKLKYGIFQIPKAKRGESSSQAERDAYKSFLEKRAERTYHQKLSKLMGEIKLAAQAGRLPPNMNRVQARALAFRAIKKTQAIPAMRTRVRRLRRKMMRILTATRPLTMRTASARRNETRTVTDGTTGAALRERYVNLTGATLRGDVMKLMERPANFCPSLTKLDIYEICAETELACDKMEQTTAEWVRRTIIQTMTEVKMEDNMMTDERRTMNELRMDNHELVILPSDKDNKLVIMRRETYILQFQELLRDAYETVEPPDDLTMPAKKFDRNLKWILQETVNPYVTDRRTQKMIFDRFRAFNACCGKLRGTVKTHKLKGVGEKPTQVEDLKIPFRPVCNMRSAPIFRLQQAMRDMVKWVMDGMNQHRGMKTIENTMELKRWLEKIGERDGARTAENEIARTDVKDMFTRVERSRAIKIFVNVLKREDPKIIETKLMGRELGIPRGALWRCVDLMLELANDVLMNFNGIFYRTPAFAMGAPLSGFLCSIYVTALEKATFAVCRGVEGRRYADDSTLYGEGDDMERLICTMNHSVSGENPRADDDEDEERIGGEDEEGDGVEVLGRSDTRNGMRTTRVKDEYGTITTLNECMSRRDGRDCDHRRTKSAVTFVTERGKLTTENVMLDLRFTWKEEEQTWRFRIYRKPTKSRERTPMGSAYSRRYHTGSTWQYVQRALRLTDGRDDFITEMELIREDAERAGLKHNPYHYADMIMEKANPDYKAAKPRVWVLTSGDGNPVKMAEVLKCERGTGWYATEDGKYVTCPTWNVRPVDAGVGIAEEGRVPRPWSHMRYDEKVAERRRTRGGDGESEDGTTEGEDDEPRARDEEDDGGETSRRSETSEGDEPGVERTTRIGEEEWRSRRQTRRTKKEVVDERPILVLPCMNDDVENKLSVLRHVVRIAYRIRTLQSYFCTPVGRLDDEKYGAGVYALRCFCGAIYVGETTRTYEVRGEEHKKEIKRWRETGRWTNGMGHHLATHAGEPGTHGTDGKTWKIKSLPKRSMQMARIYEALAAKFVPKILLINDDYERECERYRCMRKIHGGWEILLGLYGDDWVSRLPESRRSLTQVPSDSDEGATDESSGTEE